MKKTFTTLLLIVFLSSCSVFQETTSYEEVDNTKEDAGEVYVFDEVNEDETNTSEIKDLNNEIDNTLKEDQKNKDKTNFESKKTVIETVTEPEASKEERIKSVTTYEQSVSNIQFFVQLGAFSTLTRAELFSSQIESQVPFGMSIIFDASKNLYIVRSLPYTSRDETEIIRDRLKQKSKFKGCFIVTE